MSNNIILNGKFVTLRPVTTLDAEFILRLRQKDFVAKYMHHVEHDINHQIKWIENHQKIEGDYYFLIWSNLTQERLGTISLYNKDGDHCEIGRAASFGNAIENVEAFFLIFDFAFNKLDYRYLDGTVVHDNYSVKSLTRKFGVVHLPEIHNIDGMQLQYGKVTKADYYAKRPAIINLLEKATKVLTD